MERMPEILAPAGDFATLKAAVSAGADAIYLGGEQFGARAFAKNFTEEELCSAIDYAHLHGRKIYLTVNTLVKEREFDQLYGYLLPYYKQGLDAVIVQDMGVMEYIRRQFPEMDIHAQYADDGYECNFSRMAGEAGAVNEWFRKRAFASGILRKYVTGPILRLSVLYMELFVIAIPDSVRSAV